MLLVTVLGVAVVAFSVLNLLAHGPSATWQERFVMTFRETSALKWAPDLFLTEEEIAEIVNRHSAEPEEETDPSVLPEYTPLRKPEAVLDNCTLFCYKLMCVCQK